MKTISTQLKTGGMVGRVGFNVALETGAEHE